MCLEHAMRVLAFPAVLCLVSREGGLGFRLWVSDNKLPFCFLPRTNSHTSTLPDHTASSWASKHQAYHKQGNYSSIYFPNNTQWEITCTWAVYVCWASAWYCIDLLTSLPLLASNLPHGVKSCWPYLVCQLSSICGAEVYTLSPVWHSNTSWCSCTWGQVGI